MDCEACGHVNKKDAEVCFVCGTAFKDGVYQLTSLEDGSISSNSGIKVLGNGLSGASPFLRIFSYFIDGLFIFAIVTLVKGLASLAGLSFIFGSIKYRLAIAVVINSIYGAYFESSPRQASPGKRVMNIYVGDKDGSRITFFRALARNFAKGILIVSRYGIVIDFPVAFFTQKKQTVHDIVSGCYIYIR